MVIDKEKGKKWYKEAFDNYENHLNNYTVYTLKKGFCIPLECDDRIRGFLDPNTRNIIWSDGQISIDMSWEIICEYIAYYYIRDNNFMYRLVNKELNIIGEPTCSL
tara:strand:+ start:876 stop:1193 length:318 start_codon:yes stop_codon:yes gene_type:complete